jgi:hypothetical protein
VEVEDGTSKAEKWVSKAKSLFTNPHEMVKLVQFNSGYALDVIHFEVEAKGMWNDMNHCVRLLVLLSFRHTAKISLNYDRIRSMMKWLTKAEHIDVFGRAFPSPKLNLIEARDKANAGLQKDEKRYRKVSATLPMVWSEGGFSVSIEDPFKEGLKEEEVEEDHDESTEEESSESEEEVVEKKKVVENPLRQSIGPSKTKFEPVTPKPLKRGKPRDDVPFVLDVKPEAPKKKAPAKKQPKPSAPLRVVEEADDDDDLSGEYEDEIVVSVHESRADEDDDIIAYDPIFGAIRRA